MFEGSFVVLFENAKVHQCKNKIAYNIFSNIHTKIFLN